MTIKIQSKVFKHPVLAFPEADRPNLFPDGLFALVGALVVGRDGLEALSIDRLQYCIAWTARPGDPNGTGVVVMISRLADREDAAKLDNDGGARWDAWPFEPGEALDAPWKIRLKAMAEERV